MLKPESVDKYSGEAGTFINHPTKGVRIPLAEWEKEQAAIKKAHVEPVKPEGEGDAISPA
jgi:hypothetical protein